MPNEQLQNYIKEGLRVGGSKEDIKKNLLASGWRDPDIEEAFGVLEAQTMIPVPLKEPIKEPTQPKSRKKIGWIILAAVILALGVGAYVFFSKSRTSILSGQPQQAPNQAQNQITTQATTSVPAPAASPAPPTPIAATCTDSDASLGASAIYTKGTVTSIDSSGKTQTLTDDCADATYLEEFICYESPVGSGHYASGRQVVKCANGCANGACKK